MIQKCIENIPADRIGFMLSAFRGQVSSLSMHPYGCRVIQVLNNLILRFSFSSCFRFSHCTLEQCLFFLVYRGFWSVAQLSMSVGSLLRRYWNQYASFRRTNMAIMLHRSGIPFLTYKSFTTEFELNPPTVQVVTDYHLKPMLLSGSMSWRKGHLKKVRES